MSFYQPFIVTMSILRRFWDIARYWSQFAHLNLSHLYMKPPLGVTLCNFAEIFGDGKPGLAYGVICVILGLAILVELRHVTDRQTDRRTHDDSIYRASIASRGNKSSYNYFL